MYIAILYISGNSVENLLYYVGATEKSVTPCCRLSFNHMGKLDHMVNPQRI